MSGRSAACLVTGRGGPARRRRLAGAALCTLAAIAMFGLTGCGGDTGAKLDPVAGESNLSAKQLYELFRLRKRIQDLERVLPALNRVEAILRRADVDYDQAPIRAMRARLAEVAAARSAEERRAATAAVAAAAERVSTELVRHFPSAFVADAPNDAGKKLLLVYKLDEPAESLRIVRDAIDEPRLDQLTFTATPDGLFGSKADERLLRVGQPYRYTLSYVPEGSDTRKRLAVVSAAPRPEFLHTDRIWFLIITLIVCGSVVFFIRLARKGVRLKIRKIAGLEAVDEAVGRATEMGRPILFIPGIQDMNEIQTVAGLIVLGRVSRVAAEYDAPIEVPTARSLVMTAARETVAASYLNAGRPDAFDERKIYYTTDEQFGYVAAVTGTMVREEPATCFYMGQFYAESLIFAETGNEIGAIQIAGTAMPAQLPFFVAACDYTLIGEEFFAASAYLSGEPQQLGSLKGQDVGKVIGIVLTIVGVLLVTLLTLSTTGVPDYLEEYDHPLARGYDILVNHVLELAEQ